MGEVRDISVFRVIVSLVGLCIFCFGYGGIGYYGGVCVADGNYVVVDDMESYDDSNNYIWDTWLDGCRISSADNGSCIELVIDPCGPVHKGSQSMEYFYYHGIHFLGFSTYSEITREYDPPLDWSSNREKALVIWFRGMAGNDSTSMWLYLNYDYVSTSFFYGDYGEDPEDIKKEEWIEWNINLLDLVEVEADLASVNAISIGFGDKIGNEEVFADGTMYFDDIRLYPARCLDRDAPAGDFSGDCIVDGRDLKIMGDEWLHTSVGASSTTVYALGDYNDCQAKGPSPSDGQVEVGSSMSEVVLCWESGSDIGSRGRHAVYFGSDANCVANAELNDPDCWISTQRDWLLCVNIGNLPLWETFYWRVDELNSDTTICKGKVWSFTTGCELAVSDMNIDCVVNFKDYAELMAEWLDEVPFWPVE